MQTKLAQMQDLVNEDKRSDRFIQSFKEIFDLSGPYRHGYIDNFLNDDFVQSLCDHFPGPEDMRRHYKNINEQKSEGSSFDKYHPDFKRIRDMLISDDFLIYLEKLTGIEQLSYADDHRGTGLHLGLDGSFLDVHVDFSIHPLLKLHRRLNILLFLEKGWKDEYGGHFEIWDKKVKTCHHRIAPMFNRLVMFEAGNISYHGYGKITVPEGVARKSMYAYYFTPPQKGIKYHDTIFKARPEDSTGKKVTTYFKENAKNGVKKMLMAIGMRKFFEKFE